MNEAEGNSLALHQRLKLAKVFETLTSGWHWLLQWGAVNNSYSCKGSVLICEDEQDKSFMIQSYAF